MPLHCSCTAAAAATPTEKHKSRNVECTLQSGVIRRCIACERRAGGPGSAYDTASCIGAYCKYVQHASMIPAHVILQGNFAWGPAQVCLEILAHEDADHDSDGHCRCGVCSRVIMSCRLGGCCHERRVAVTRLVYFAEILCKNSISVP